MNVEINGATPSETIGGDRPDLPIRLVHAVAEASRLLRDEARPDAAWAVDTAWLSVLDGDIDDIPAHVALEWRARS